MYHALAVPKTHEGNMVPIANEERPLTIPQIQRLYPGHRGAEKTSPSTISRWILKGCRSFSGETIRLAAIRVGGRWLVRSSDLEKFISALGNMPADPPTTRTPTSRAKASDVAAAKLAALGA
jgi:hypothetical protein